MEPVPRTNTCAKCGNLAKMRCTRCCITYYCSKECQKPDWDEHKQKCTPIDKIWKCTAMSHNPLITYFGLDVMCQLAHRIVNISGIGPIVSLGSGQGIIEGFMRYVTGVEIICIDPDPGSYQKKSQPNPKYSEQVNYIVNGLHTKPQFKTIEQFSETSDDPNCTLMINWPSPDQEIPWDTYAIETLAPENIIVMVELFGGAGSSKLTTWLSKFDGIYSPSELDVYNVLKIVKSDTNRPDSKMRVYGKYFINDIIKGYNGDDFEIPSDFSSMSPKTQKLTAIQMTKTSYVYAIVILSRRPRASTIRADPSKFTKSYMSNSQRMQLKLMEMMCGM